DDRGPAVRSRALRLTRGLARPRGRVDLSRDSAMRSTFGYSRPMAPNIGTEPALARTVVTDAAEATRALGTRLAAVARAGDLICLWGELGAGKTQFAKGFGAGLGVTSTINSPSFVLMAEYPGRLPLFHIDL